MAKSIYEDLGYSDAEGMDTKASLVWLLDRTLSKRNLSVTDAASDFGISADALANLLRGRFRDIAPERLLEYLRLTGYDIEVRIVASPDAPGSLTLVPPPHLDGALRH